MRIEVRLLASLRAYAGDAPGGVCRLDVRDGSTAGDVLSALNIPEDTPGIILLNGAQQESGTALRDGDMLIVFPPIAGG